MGQFWLLNSSLTHFIASVYTHWLSMFTYDHRAIHSMDPLLPIPCNPHSTPCTASYLLACDTYHPQSWWRVRGETGDVLGSGWEHDMRK